MPPGKPPLDAHELRVLERWIEEGLPWSSAAVPAGGRHWAFEPVRNPAPPADPSGWALGPIDRFIAAKWRENGLEPAGPADKRALLRRVYFDLTGLPPSPGDIRAFETDRSRDAYAKVVERLLASPRYGERWGRYWMDLARYADTAGDNADYPIPEIRLYRDYVIDSFNSDKPYNQFLEEQIAGDILARSGPPEKYAGRVIATGFLALSRRYGTAPMELWHLTIEDTIDTIGRAVMGLTLRCARCHDHKFDPVTTENYYSLYGYFASTRYPFAGAEEFESKRLPRSGFVPLAPPAQIESVTREHQQKVGALEARIQEITQAIPETGKLETLENQIRSKIRRIEELERIGQPSDVKKTELAELEQERSRLLARLGERGAEVAERAAQLIPLRGELRKLKMAGLPPGVRGAYAVWEGEPKDVFIQVRGNPEEKGALAKRAPPQFLCSPHPISAPAGASGRLELAGWLASPEHPLTARVMANRVWQYHFGQGLVSTPSNFGLRGEIPTHPELLDWLAAYFVDNGWSFKNLHRAILLSKTYQLSSRSHSAGIAKDPGNRLYWRYSRRRLDAEAIRDAMLAAGGNLDLRRPEEHPFPPIEKWNYTQHFPFKAVYDSNHRSVYLMTQRLHRHPYLALFDGPDPNSSTDVRTSATIPLQALYLMNHPFVKQQAEGLARRTRTEPDPRRRVADMYWWAWGRPPSGRETAGALRYLEQYRAELAKLGTGAGDAGPLSWSSYAHVLLAASEFLYLD